MFCVHCGKEINDKAVVCIHCGLLVKNEKIRSEKSFFIIKLFMLIGCIVNAILLIPLCWCIPMTVNLFKKLENKEKCSAKFKICTLIFVSLVSGILLLCDDNI